MPWQFDTNLSKVLWSVGYLGVGTVRGRFTDIQADLQIDADNPLEWRTSVTINAASLYSGYTMMDDHLRSDDFLDVARYPTIEFRSSRIEALPAGGVQVPIQKYSGAVGWEPHTDHLKISGDLILHGVTRPSELDAWYFGQVTDGRGQTRRSFTAETSVRRGDFNLLMSSDRAERSIAGEVVNLTIDVIATRISD